MHLINLYFKEIFLQLKTTSLIVLIFSIQTFEPERFQIEAGSLIHSIIQLIQSLDFLIPIIIILLLIIYPVRLFKKFLQQQTSTTLTNPGKKYSKTYQYLTSAVNTLIILLLLPISLMIPYILIGVILFGLPITV